MSTFSIQHGASVLYSWDLDAGVATFHARAVQRDGMLVLNEAERVSFLLTSPSEETEHRMFVGDVPLSDLTPVPEDAHGIALGAQLHWRELPYFESARGHTRLVLEAQPQDSATDAWRMLAVVDLFILPSKLGEGRYQQMAEDLQQVSRSLLVDLYGKSRQTRDLKYSKEGKLYQSREHELAAIDDVVERLSVHLQAIARRPASRVVAAPFVQNYWGGEHLSPTAVNAICRSGFSPRQSVRPIKLRGQKKVESFDVPEHRVVRAFLEILGRRAQLCAKAAAEHIRAIESDRHLRHIRRGSDPSLYETIDVPRIRRLQEAIAKADRTTNTLRTLAAFPFISGAKAELAAVRGGAFQRSREYQALLAVIRRYLLANAVWYEGDDLSAVTKLTSRLFEQWCFLRLVDAFRAAGLSLREWDDALRQNLRSRFILDFDRGLKFEGLLTSELRIRVRYEPWVLGVDSATRAQETLCRVSATDVAWSPDIVVECLTRNGEDWMPAYVIVLDCKYTAKIRNQHWNDTAKYLQIRCTRSRRQVVKQLWLVSPISGDGAGRIDSEDPGVQFDAAGPTCAPDEAVNFRLSVIPGVEKAQQTDVFLQLAQGTVSFLRRHFGAIPVATGE